MKHLLIKNTKWDKGGKTPYRIAVKLAQLIDIAKYRKHFSRDDWPQFEAYFEAYDGCSSRFLDLVKPAADSLQHLVATAELLEPPTRKPHYATFYTIPEAAYDYAAQVERFKQFTSTLGFIKSTGCTGNKQINFAIQKQLLKVPISEASAYAARSMSQYYWNKSPLPKYMLTSSKKPEILALEGFIEASSLDILTVYKKELADSMSLARHTHKIPFVSKTSTKLRASMWDLTLQYITPEACERYIEQLNSLNTVSPKVFENIPIIRVGDFLEQLHWAAETPLYELSGDPTLKDATITIYTPEQVLTNLRLQVLADSTSGRTFRLRDLAKRLLERDEDPEHGGFLRLTTRRLLIEAQDLCPSS